MLYLTFSITENPCHYDHFSNNVIRRIDKVSKKVVGVAIFNFMQSMEAEVEIESL